MSKNVKKIYYYTKISGILAFFILTSKNHRLAPRSPAVLRDEVGSNLYTLSLQERGLYPVKIFYGVY